MTTNLRELDDSIKDRLFRSLKDDIFDEPVLGEIEVSADPLQYQPLTKFEPVHRMLSVHDEAYAEKMRPGMTRAVRRSHRKILLCYATEISRDVEMLWNAKCAASRLADRWDVGAHLAWAWRAEKFILRLRLAAILHGAGFSGEASANRALSAL